jgi:hypothetical protein
MNDIGDRRCGDAVAGANKEMPIFVTKIPCGGVAGMARLPNSPGVVTE